MQEKHRRSRCQVSYMVIRMLACGALTSLTQNPQPYGSISSTTVNNSLAHLGSIVIDCIEIIVKKQTKKQTNIVVSGHIPIIKRAMETFLNLNFDWQQRWSEECNKNAGMVNINRRKCWFVFYFPRCLPFVYLNRCSCVPTPATWNKRSNNHSGNRKQSFTVKIYLRKLRRYDKKK